MLFFWFSIVLKWIPKSTVAALAQVKCDKSGPGVSPPSKGVRNKAPQNCMELGNLPEMKRTYRNIHFKCPGLHVFFSRTPGSFLVWWDKTRVPFCPENWAGVGIIHKNHLTGTFFSPTLNFFISPIGNQKKSPSPTTNFPSPPTPNVTYLRHPLPPRALGQWPGVELASASTLDV